MSEFQVTSEYVSDAAAACKSTAGEIRERLASLQSYIASVEEWRSDVESDTFQQLMTEYSAYAVMLYNALTDIGSGLTGDYVSCTVAGNANAGTARL